MDPYQQNQGAPGGNPYEFILNPEKPSKQKIGGPHNNFIKLIVFIVGGAILLMVVTAILLNVLTPKQVGKTEFISLTQTQNELIRISDQGSKDARQQTTKNLATTIQFSMLTQQKETIALLAKKGTKVDKKILVLKQNAATDQKLTSAKATSTFDATYTQIAEEELQKYANELKTLYEQVTNPSEKDTLSDYYKQTQQLISQIPYTEDRINSAGQ